ncbi:hypothetical protein HK405_012815 [Cladochytrium tenue]|nr:hypothetical protein HK405_012815 [Cladochytrium tenue]
MAIPHLLDDRRSLLVDYCGPLAQEIADQVVDSAPEQPLLGGIDAGSLVDAVAAGYDSGVLAVTVGTGFLRALIESLDCRLAGNSRCSIAYFALTDSKLVDLLSERNVTLDGLLKQSIAPFFRPISIPREASTILAKGCSLPFVMILQFVHTHLGDAVSTFTIVGIKSKE